MTTRVIYARGLIAGLTYTEMRHMFPGFVVDMFVARLKYDDEQHGIRRKKEKPVVF